MGFLFQPRLQCCPVCFGGLCTGGFLLNLNADGGLKGVLAKSLIWCSNAGFRYWSAAKNWYYTVAQLGTEESSLVSNKLFESRISISIFIRSVDTYFVGVEYQILGSISSCYQIS